MPAFEWSTNQLTIDRVTQGTLGFAVIVRRQPVLPSLSSSAFHPTEPCPVPNGLSQNLTPLPHASHLPLPSRNLLTGKPFHLSLFFPTRLSRASSARDAHLLNRVFPTLARPYRNFNHFCTYEMGVGEGVPRAKSRPAGITGGRRSSSRSPGPAFCGSRTDSGRRSPGGEPSDGRPGFLDRFSNHRGDRVSNHWESGGKRGTKAGTDGTFLGAG